MLVTGNFKHLWVDTVATANVKQDNNHNNRDAWAGTGQEKSATQSSLVRNFKHLCVDIDRTAQAEEGNEDSHKVSEPVIEAKKAGSKCFTARRSFKHLWTDPEATGKVMQGNQSINKDSELGTQLEKAVSKTSSDLGHDMFAVIKPRLSPGPKTSILKPLTSVYSPTSPSSESSWSAYTYRGPNTRPPQLLTGRLPPTLPLVLLSVGLTQPLFTGPQGHPDQQQASERWWAVDGAQQQEGSPRGIRAAGPLLREPHLAYHRALPSPRQR